MQGHLIRPSTMVGRSSQQQHNQKVRQKIATSETFSLKLSNMNADCIQLNHQFRFQYNNKMSSLLWKTQSAVINRLVNAKNIKPFTIFNHLRDERSQRITDFEIALLLSIRWIFCCPIVADNYSVLVETNMNYDWCWWRKSFSTRNPLSLCVTNTRIVILIRFHVFWPLIRLSTRSYEGNNSGVFAKIEKKRKFFGNTSDHTR